MNIVVLCLSPNRGGLELYVLDEIRNLYSKGHECTAVVSRGSYLAKVLEEEKIPFLLLNVSFVNLPLVAATRLARQLDSLKTQILHIHWSNDFYLAGLTKYFCKSPVKLVYTRHMNYTRHKRDIFHRWLYARVDLLLVGTKLLAKQAQQYIPIEHSQIKLAYIGVCAHEGTANDCEAIFSNDFPRRPLNLAIFGRIEQGKGQHIAIDAVKQLTNAGKDISLTMIGHTIDQKYQDDLKLQLNKFNLTSRIRFMGFVSDASRLMNCFDIILLTTYCETFGLVLIEAMRAGVAVIGTNAGGVPEIIEHGVSGLLVKPNDPDDLRLAIDMLYNHSESIQKLAAAGKHRADEMFSAEKHFIQLESILQGCIA